MKTKCTDVLERTYNRMWPTLCDALSQCSPAQKEEVLTAGLKAYLRRTHRSVHFTDSEIRNFLSIVSQ